MSTAMSGLNVISESKFIFYVFEHLINDIPKLFWISLAGSRIIYLFFLRKLTLKLNIFMRKYDDFHFIMENR